jgi:hypothetical protein
MEYRKIALTCECGTEPAGVSEFGLTEDHQLLIHWECAKCSRQVYYLKSLADCWWACPLPPGASMTSSDRRFLKRLGVEDPEKAPG